MKRKCFNLFYYWCLIFCFIIHSAISIAQTVKFRYPKTKGAERFGDVYEIMDVVAKKTEEKFGKVKFLPSDLTMSEAGYKKHVKYGGIDIIWSGANKELEKELYPIRIPIRMGLLGYRIFLIDKAKQKFFPKGMTANNLKKFSVGQGKGWGDIVVFKSNGFRVIEGSYDNLFQMVCGDRFDYFSRGIAEAPLEYGLQKDKNPCLHVEENILLFYPWPYFFYINPNKKDTLGKRLTEGLELMVKNGDILRILLKYHGKKIEKVNLKNRTLIKIENLDYLSKETAALMEKKEFWYDPFTK